MSDYALIVHEILALALVSPTISIDLTVLMLSREDLLLTDKYDGARPTWMDCAS